MQRADDLRIGDSETSRLVLAVVVSLALHVSLVLAVRTQSAPSGAPQMLRASLVPVSAPEPVQASVAAESFEPRELKVPIERREAVDAQPDDQPPAAARAGTHGVQRDAASGDAAVYYTTQELDVRATPVKMETTLALEKSLLLGRLVRVKLRLFISEQGNVDRFEVLEADGLTSSVSLDDVTEIRFRPAQKGGRPVKSQKVVELTFAP
jgi:hypothetical protein